MPRKRLSEDAELDGDMEDTDQSPLRIVEEHERADLQDSTRRKLAMEVEVPTIGVEQAEMKKGETEIDGEEAMPPAPPQYVSPRERSKQRKLSKSDKVMGTSAASTAEDRRTQ